MNKFSLKWMVHLNSPYQQNFLMLECSTKGWWQFWSCSGLRHTFLDGPREYTSVENSRRPIHWRGSSFWQLTWHIGISFRLSSLQPLLSKSPRSVGEVFLHFPHWLYTPHPISQPPPPHTCTSPIYCPHLYMLPNSLPYICGFFRPVVACVLRLFIIIIPRDEGEEIIALRILSHSSSSVINNSCSFLPKCLLQLSVAWRVSGTSYADTNAYKRAKVAI